VPVNDDDTAETLSARILEQEHLAYPEAIARVLGGHYVIQGRRYVRLHPHVGQPPAISDK
jgi:phosphoribosylglycinamide formyltransferase-1